MKNKPQPLDLEEIKNGIKQRIKSACEFYLRYIDNPRILEISDVLSLEEKRELRDFISLLNELNKTKIEDVEQYHFIIESYNKWLFKLAFRDVLECGKQ